MSRLIASILLSILVFPLAAVVYLVVFFLLESYRAFNFRGEVAFMFAGVLTWVFIAWYWIFVWRTTVTWTPARVARTLYAAAAAAVAGVTLGAITGHLDGEFGFFVGSVTSPLLWLVGTVLVWRETAAERGARLGAVSRTGGGPAIPCPTCGYDMTGLKSTRCPECGSEFTLDELILAQPQRAAAELER